MISPPQTLVIMDSSEAWKKKGNEAMSRNVNEAIECYTNAIELDGSNHILFSNRAAALMGKGVYRQALEDIDECIRLDDAWPKGHCRKGKVLFMLGRFEDAKAAYQEGLKLKPSDKPLQEGLDAVVKALSDNKGEVATQDALFQACHEGDVAAMNRQLHLGVDVNSSPKHQSFTALCVGASCGHGSIVQGLLDAGADVNSKEAIPTAINVAAHNGYASIVALLADAGADVDAQNPENGRTPLCSAVLFRREKAVDVLLAAGASLRIKNNDGFTPLVAAIADSEEPASASVVRRLLDAGAGADINERLGDDMSGASILHVAITYQAGPKVVEMLLQAGAEPEAADRSPYCLTPLQLAGLFAAGHQPPPTRSPLNGKNLTAVVQLLNQWVGDKGGGVLTGVRRFEREHAS